MIPTFFFKEPFAQAGDLTAVPIPSQSDGSVSYTDGYGIDYEQDPLIDPLTAKDIERRKMNQLFNSVTLALQQYQSWGIPNFISTSDNGGSPFSYAKYAYALYDDGINGPRIFQSNSNTNTNIPAPSGVISSAWRLIDSVSEQATVFNNVTFDGAVMNGNVVYWDSGSSTYKQALANGTGTQQAIGIADVPNSRVISFGIVPGGSGFTAGAVYYLSTTVAGALTSTKPANNVVQCAIAKNTTTLFLNIQIEIPGSFLPVGTSIDYFGTDGAQPGFLLCDGSAVSRTTYAALFAKIGTTQGVGDGSTTFNLPLCARMSSVGVGGTVLSGPGNTIGVASSFTTQLQTVPLTAVESHTHGVVDPGHAHTYTAQSSPPGSAGVDGGVGIQPGVSTSSDVTGITLDAAGGSADTLNTYHPTYIVSKQIYTGVF